MERWEYMFVVLNKWNVNETLGVLNEAGKDGWEVVSHFWGRFTLKRRLQA